MVGGVWWVVGGDTVADTAIGVLITIAIVTATCGW